MKTSTSAQEPVVDQIAIDADAGDGPALGDVVSAPVSEARRLVNRALTRANDDFCGVVSELEDAISDLQIMVEEGREEEELADEMVDELEEILKELRNVSIPTRL